MPRKKRVIGKRLKSIMEEEEEKQHQQQEEQAQLQPMKEEEKEEAQLQAMKEEEKEEEAQLQAMKEEEAQLQAMKEEEKEEEAQLQAIKEEEKEDQAQLQPIKEEKDLTVPDIKNPDPEPDPDLSARKLTFLRPNFWSVPFRAKKTLDLFDHEHLLRALDLWEFATLHLPSDLRPDLLTPFVANYDPPSHHSFINGVSISVGRSELAQALNLPTKKEKEKEKEKDKVFEFSAENSIATIEEFMSIYVLLEADRSDLPEEAMTAIRLVKEGKAGEVDWVDVMWVLVEKDLLDLPRSENCRYGPHLQCLIQWQSPELFDEDEGGVQIKSTEEVSGPELSLRLAEENWVGQGQNVGFDHCLKPCSSIDRGVEFENLCRGEEEGRGDEFSTLERLTSEDLLHGMESVRISYTSHMDSLEPGSGEFLSAGVNADENLEVDDGAGNSLFFGNNGKRPFRDVDDDDDVGQFHQNDRPKRMRDWGERAPLDFNSNMEQIECILGRAKMLYDDKDQACMSAQMEIQYLTEMLKEKDQIIQTLEKTRVEGKQNWMQTVSKYEKDLNLSAELMVGYKKALKQAQKDFAEYRKKCQHRDEPFYRDVGGTGGLVLSVRELERLRREKELEMCRVAEEVINDFGTVWCEELEASANRVFMLQSKLVGLEKAFELLKERNLPNRNAESEGTREDFIAAVSTSIDTEEP